MNEDYYYYDMAIDTSGNLYWISIGGSLYTRKLNDTSSCQFLGVWGNSEVNSLVCDVSGNVYAAGTNYRGDTAELFEYQPKTKIFSTLGILPFFSLGDLFFYEGRLFLIGGNSIAEITIADPSQSCIYMNLGKLEMVYAAFSIQNGNCSDAYVINTGNTSSTLYKVNLYAKTISAPLCTYPFVINGAASIYKYFPSIVDSNTCTSVDSCNSLPIQLLNFSYAFLNKTVKLEWQTATEINSAYFLVEKSTDGINFSTIGKEIATGISNSLKQYTFTDENPSAINYYRLKEVDKDGKYTYSNILLATLQQTQALNIIGNPVQNNLQVQINTNQSQTNQLSIFDFLGRKVKTFTVQKGLQDIEVTSLSAGVYVLQLVIANGEVVNERFIKSN
jgi:hypothetical protein